MHRNHWNSSGKTAHLGFIGVGLLTAVACGANKPATGDGAEPYPQAQTLVQFELPRGGGFSEFLSVPFPSYFRQKADGTLDLSAFPNPASISLVDSYIRTIGDNTRGFGTNAASYFKLTGAIDIGSIPLDPGASLGPDAPIFLIDVDDNSPARGRRVPLRMKYESAKTTYLPENTLIALPVYGFPLRPNTQHAVVITRQLLDANGVNVGASPEFELLKSRTAIDDAVAESARAVYAPVFDYLEANGTPRNSIAVVALFRTQDALTEMDRIYKFVTEKEAEPVVQSLEFKGEYRFPNSTEPPYHLYRGSYTSPNYQTGDAPYSSSGGAITFNEAGEPIRQRVETIPFELAVPKYPPPVAGFPIVLYAHGTGGSERSFRDDGTAARLASLGIASLGIPQPLHGSRYVPPQGMPVPTGRDLEDAAGSAFFNYLNPIAGINNVRQSAIDEFQRMRLVKSMKIDPPVSAISVRIKFDPEKVYFMGHSQGGFTGPLFLALEPAVKGAVLSGAGAGIAVGMLTKTKPFNIKPLISAALGLPREEPLDEFHILVNLVQTYFERGDSMNYAPRIVESPPDGRPKNILMTEGLKDEHAAPASVEALAIAIGVTPVVPVSRPVVGLILKGRAEVASPVRGNVKGAATAVLVQYPMGDHWVALNDRGAIDTWKRFFQSLVDSGIATVE